MVVLWDFPWDLPSGKQPHSSGKVHHFQWENSQTFYDHVAMWNCQKFYGFHVDVPFWFWKLVRLSHRKNKHCFDHVQSTQQRVLITFQKRWRKGYGITNLRCLAKQTTVFLARPKRQMHHACQTSTSSCLLATKPLKKPYYFDHRLSIMIMVRLAVSAFSIKVATPFLKTKHTLALQQKSGSCGLGMIHRILTIIPDFGHQVRLLYFSIIYIYIYIISTIIHVYIYIYMYMYTLYMDIVIRVCIYVFIHIYVTTSIHI